MFRTVRLYEELAQGFHQGDIEPGSGVDLASCRFVDVVHRFAIALVQDFIQSVSTGGEASEQQHRATTEETACYALKVQGIYCKLRYQLVAVKVRPDKAPLLKELSSSGPGLRARKRDRSGGRTLSRKALT